MITDPIADYLTRIRNAMQARHSIVEIPASNVKKEITKVLHEKGYIRHYKLDDQDSVQGTIKIALKYDHNTKKPAIVKLQ
ncbi:MAG: 30S ribosomal protein S8, partial [Bacteroidota bacterium]